MIKKIKVFSLLVLLVIAYSCSGKSNKKTIVPATDSIANNQTGDVKSNSDSSWIDQIQFGYSNEKGDLILVDSVELPVPPTSLIYALDSTGNKTSITYKTYQPKGEKNTGRDIYFNFENAPGHIFSASTIMDEEQTSVLFTEKFFETRSMLKVRRTDKKGLPEQVRKKIESDKSRKVKNAREIATLDNFGNIYLMEFSRKKDSALASLVLVYNDNFIYYDFPAIYDQQSTWRVDDGGEFWLDGIEILAVFKQNDTIELVFDWVGAEGYNTRYLQQGSNTFKEIKNHYRYTAPQ